jgi:hypothetical protein
METQLEDKLETERAYETQRLAPAPSYKGLDLKERSQLNRKLRYAGKTVYR